MKQIIMLYLQTYIVLYMNYISIKLEKIEKINKTKSWFFAKILLVNTSHTHQEKKKESQNK